MANLTTLNKDLIRYIAKFLPYQDLENMALTSAGMYDALGTELDLVGRWSTKPISYIALKGHIAKIRSVVFSRDSKMLASGSKDRTIRLWDIGSPTLKQQLLGHEGSVKSIAFSPNGQSLASGSSDKTVRLWDIWR